MILDYGDAYSHIVVQRSGSTVLAMEHNTIVRKSDTFTFCHHIELISV